MAIVKRKPEVRTVRLSVLADEGLKEDLDAYAEMIGEPDRSRIICELVRYALRRDKDFREYKKGRTVGKEGGNERGI